MIKSQNIQSKIFQSEREMYDKKIVHTIRPKNSNLASQNNDSQKNVQDQSLPVQQSQYYDDPHIDPQQIKLKTIDSTKDDKVNEQPKIIPKRNKFGNMLIFCENKDCFLSLGPNYLFFFFAYLSFTLATIYLIKLANSSIESNSFKIFNFIFCWTQNLSYLLVALSNPGVDITQQNMSLTPDQLKSKRICNKCGLIQQRKTYHCRQCDVCVKNYDHHCPWTSKCIGGGNLKRFYFFVCMTPFYIFYYMVVFMICMANLTIGANKNLKVHIPTF